MKTEDIKFNNKVVQFPSHKEKNNTITFWTYYPPNYFGNKLPYFTLRDPFSVAFVFKVKEGKIND